MRRAATSVSRLGCLAEREEGQSGRRRTIQHRWYGPCSMLLVTMLLLQSGCFFFLPITRAENVPPQIIHSSPGDGETLVIDLPEVVAFVEAEDDDGDSLFCEWSIDFIGELGPGTPLLNPDLQGCALTLDQDPEYDGRTLTCQVFDPSKDSDEISWPIEVVEAP